jgi:acyl carrier protein
MDDCLARLNVVFQEVFLDDELVVTRETTAQDVEGWDSLTHVSLIVNIEKAFGIQFRSSEVTAFKNVGEMADLIQERLGGIK